MGLLSFIVAVYAAQAVVTVYEMNQDLPKYTDIKVLAGGEAIGLYAVKIALWHSWPGRPGNIPRQDAPVAMFDTDGPTDIVVTRANTKTAIVRPLRWGVTATVSGDSISFTLPRTGHYTLEFDGATEDALMIFANPPMETPRGTILKAGTYGDQTLRADNPVLFLMPGAVVAGKVVLEVNNSRIAGRGIIDGSWSHNWENGGGATLPLETYGYSNVAIDGITVFDPDGWSVQLQKSTAATVNNVKLVTSRQNADGFSIQSSQRTKITNSFLRIADDAIVVKNYGSLVSTGHVFTDNVIWSDFAQGIEIGVETNAGYDGQPNPVEISNITYERIDILHAYHKAPISIHNGDGCDIHDITYNDIVLEDAQMGNGDGWNYLFDFTNMNGTEMGGDGSWTHNNGPRKIRNISVKNVSVLGGNLPGARIANGQGEASFNNVTFTGVTFKGDPIDICKIANAPAGVTCA